LHTGSSNLPGLQCASRNQQMFVRSLAELSSVGVLQACQSVNEVSIGVIAIFFLNSLPMFSCRFGQHMFAVPAISRLINSISSESFHFWLSCLRDVSLAECALMNEKPLPEGMAEKSPVSKIAVIENISIAMVHYSKAIAAIKVFNTTIKMKRFPNLQFCRLLVLCIHRCSLPRNICDCD
jgi:hypothetical protein